MSRPGQRFRGNSAHPFVDHSDRDSPESSKGARQGLSLRRALASSGPTLLLTAAVLLTLGLLHLSGRGLGLTRWQAAEDPDPSQEAIAPRGGKQELGEADGEERLQMAMYNRSNAAVQRQGGSEDSELAGGLAPGEGLLVDQAMDSASRQFDGLDRMPKYVLNKPFKEGTGQPHFLIDLIRTSSQDRVSFFLHGCGRVQVFLTQREKLILDGRDGKTWKDLAYERSKGGAAAAEAAEPVESVQQRQWPETGPMDRLLVIDSDDIQGIQVLKLSRLCQVLDEDESIMAVSGEIAGDFTPCKVSVRSSTLLYGTHDLSLEEQHLGSGRYCWDCDMAPPIFLANPSRLKKAGTWPSKYGPWARMAFFLRNLGKVRVKRCHGLAGFTRPSKLNVRPSQYNYNRLLQLATAFQFVRIFDGTGNVRWMGCARDGKTCPNTVASEAPAEPWHAVCCAYMVQVMLQHLRHTMGTSKWRWQLWGSSLLGITREGQLLPWKAEATVAIESKSLQGLQDRLKLQDTSVYGTFAVTRIDSSGSFSMLFSVPPPVFFPDAQASWKRSAAQLDHPVWSVERPPPSEYRDLKKAIRNHQIKCHDEVSCPVIQSPAAVQIVEEPKAHSKKHLVRATMPKSSQETLKWPVPEDAESLLNKWYGPGWDVSQCDWSTGSGKCY
mmetsp:Transcript_6461/g.18040  ORF Transcript_6461/g.18040 Transcript_6461/m.18040 type:complete len:664 (-) Transcript_6461:62-2053(-)